MHFLASIASPTIFDSLDITEDTKRDYIARLPYYIGFLQRDGISHDSLLHYKQHLRQRIDLSVASKNKYLAVARLSLRELYRQGKLSVDLSQGVKAFQQSNKHRVQGITEDEVKKLCEYLREAGDSFRIVRLRALVSLLLFQGLRQIEVCRLDVADISLSNSIAYVLGKGRDDKEPIYLHPETIKALTAYLRRSRAKSGPLFTPVERRFSDKRLTTRGLRLIVSNALRGLGIDKTVHGFRHYFATTLVKAYRSNLLQVARYTRHQSVETLQIYNDQILAASDLPAFYKSFNMQVMG